MRNYSKFFGRLDVSRRWIFCRYILHIFYTTILLQNNIQDPSKHTTSNQLSANLYPSPESEDQDTSFSPDGATLPFDEDNYTNTANNATNPANDAANAVPAMAGLIHVPWLCQGQFRAWRGWQQHGWWFWYKENGKLYWKAITDGTFCYMRTQQPSARMTNADATNQQPIVWITEEDGSYKYPIPGNKHPRAKQQTCFICHKYSTKQQNSQWMCQECNVSLRQMNRRIPILVDLPVALWNTK